MKTKTILILGLALAAAWTAGCGKKKAQHFGDRSDLVGDLAGVAGKCRTCFDDPAHVVDMVVAAALDRSARR